MLAGQVGGLLHIVHGQALATKGVFKGQQSGAGKVRVVGLDGSGNFGQRQAAVRLVVQGLRLQAAKHCATTTLPSVAMRHLADDVLVTPLAVREQCAQVALSAGRHEQGRLKAEQIGNFRLQCVDAGVIGEDVVAQGRTGHGIAHARRRLRDGIATQVNPQKASV